MMTLGALAVSTLALAAFWNIFALALSNFTSKDNWVETSKFMALLNSFTGIVLGIIYYLIKVF